MEQAASLLYVHPRYFIIVLLHACAAFLTGAAKPILEKSEVLFLNSLSSFFTMVTRIVAKQGFFTEGVRLLQAVNVTLCDRGDEESRNARIKGRPSPQHRPEDFSLTLQKFKGMEWKYRLTCNDFPSAHSS